MLLCGALRTTALLNEAYLKLVDADVVWTDRVHFFAVAARVMRRILVDHARGQTRGKRGGDVEKISLEQSMDVGAQAPAQLLDLDRALERLSARDRRKSEIVELLFFGGLTYDEAAAALEISPATLHRELKMAKAWLYKELAEGSSEVATGTPQRSLTAGAVSKLCFSRPWISIPRLVLPLWNNPVAPMSCCGRNSNPC